MGNCFSRGASASGGGEGGTSQGSSSAPRSSRSRETTQITGNAAGSSTGRRQTIPTTGTPQLFSPVKCLYVNMYANFSLVGNKPFKPRRDGTWTSPVPMTRSQLHHQRTEFWETAAQYDGQIDTWNSIRVAVELSHQNDLPTAQAVLDSAGITIPTGDLGLGCYDERGHRFVVPEYVLSEPSNIMDDDVEIRPRDSSSTAVMKREIEDSESADEVEKSYTVFPLTLRVTLCHFRYLLFVVQISHICRLKYDCQRTQKTWAFPSRATTQ